MRTLAITPAVSRFAPAFALNRGGNAPATTLGHHHDHHNLFPPNPFRDIDPGNPSSWYSAVSGFMSGLFGTRAGLEAESTNGILSDDPSYNPQANIHNKFKVSALLGRMYTLLPWIIQMFKQNLAAEKDTHNAALPAR